MKINWKVRLKNPTFWLTFIPTVVAFVYTMCEIFEIVPRVSKDTIISVIGTIVSALATLGVLVDPTTEGLSDSKRAMTYTSPNKDDADKEDE